MRYPLIDGHGNFGNIDNKPAAAMRYTEARLSRFGELMVEKIPLDTCDFKNNFDDSLQEVVFMPTLFPNVIVNGTTEGIAVGMASKMVPHNLTETYNALIASIDALLAHEPITADLLLKHMKGPDFPLGGDLIGVLGVYDYFQTGRGKLVLRSKYEEIVSKNETIIRVTNLPFKVNKAKLVEDLLNLKDTKIKEIKHVEDETDQHGICVAIHLKRDANIKVAINKMCKYTDFEISFVVNNNLLFNNQPITASMPSIFQNYIDHSLSVVYREIQYRLKKDYVRRFYLETVFWAIERSEDIIPLIRSCHGEQLFEELKAYEPLLQEEQAKIVGDIQIKQLSPFYLDKFQKEYDVLIDKIAERETLCSSNENLAKEVQRIFVAMRDKYGDERRTCILCDEKKDVNHEDFIDTEELIITYSTDNLIKATAESEFRSTKRGAKGVSSGLKDEESLKYLLSVSNKDSILFFTSIGRCHVIKAYEIPKVSRTQKGRSIYNFLTLQEGEHVVNMINTACISKDDVCLVFATRNGVVKKLSLTQLSTVRAITKVITFKDDDELINVSIAESNQDYVICTSMGFALKFNLSNVKATGRSAAGVTGIRFKTADDYVVDAIPVYEGCKMVTMTQNGFGKITEFSTLRTANRGGKGVVCQRINNSKLACMLSIPDEQDGIINELIIGTQLGQMIRIPGNQIRECGRNAKGVKLVNVAEGDYIINASLKQSEVKEDESEPASNN